MIYATKPTVFFMNLMHGIKNTRIQNEEACCFKHGEGSRNLFRNPVPDRGSTLSLSLSIFILSLRVSLDKLVIRYSVVSGLIKIFYLNPDPFGPERS